MPVPPLPADFAYLPGMYADAYFPPALVDKVRHTLQQLVAFLATGSTDPAAVQPKLDEMTMAINALQDEFFDHDSEIETMARDSIAETVERILAHFGVPIDLEEALRERDW